MASVAPQPGKLSFGPFELDLRTGELRKFGIALKLQPQPARLLGVLALHAGEVVTREQLQREVWGEDTFVDYEQGLNYCIRQIRGVLNDDPERPRYIQTLPRKGYRFIGEVTLGDAAKAADPSAEPDERSSAADLTPETETSQLAAAQLELVLHSRWHDFRLNHPYLLAGIGVGVLSAVLVLAGYIGWRKYVHHESASFAETIPIVRDVEPGTRVMIAVLPFENLTPDHDHDYFSDGMTEELIAQLGRLSPERLGVIARTSAMRYKGVRKSIVEIGKELGVQYILEGSVRRAGDQARITAQLIQVRDGTHLWAESFDGEVSGRKLIAFQEEIAKRIASSLFLRLPAGAMEVASSSSPEALDAYLRGRYHWNRRNYADIAKAIEYFERATKLDPNHALSWAGLADCYTLMADYQRKLPADLRERALRAATRAVELGPTSAETHAALGFARWRFEWDWTGAEASFKRSIELNPNYATARHWYALFLAARGRFPEAKHEIQHARELDPMSLIIMSNIAWIDYFSRDYSSALDQLHRTLAIDQNFVAAIVKVTWVADALGDHDEAMEMRKRRTRLLDDEEGVRLLETAYRSGGYKAAVRKQIEILEKHGMLTLDDAAIEWTLLGDKDKAFAALEEAAERRTGLITYLRVAPALDPLRQDQRYSELLKRIDFERQ